MSIAKRPSGIISIPLSSLPSSKIDGGAQPDSGNDDPAFVCHDDLVHLVSGNRCYVPIFPDRKATAQVPGPMCAPEVRDMGWRMISASGQNCAISGCTFFITHARLSVYSIMIRAR